MLFFKKKLEPEEIKPEVKEKEVCHTNKNNADCELVSKLRQYTQELKEANEKLSSIREISHTVLKCVSDNAVSVNMMYDWQFNDLIHALGYFSASDIKRFGYENYSEFLSAIGKGIDENKLLENKVDVLYKQIAEVKSKLGI